MNPWSGFGDWRQGVIEFYPAETVDALDTNEDEVRAALADLWETDYFDSNTGIEQKYREWALTFANDYAIGVYYHLTDACRDLRRMGRKIP